MIVFLPLIFSVYYAAGGGASAFIGTTLLIVPFAREFLRKGIPTPLFFLISGAIMGIISRNTNIELVKDIFEVSTLFLAYAAGYEFTSSIRKTRLLKVLFGVLIEFLTVVIVMFPVFYLFFSTSFFIALTLSLLFLSISPITSMILIMETNKGEDIKRVQEAEIIVRDIIQILILISISHFTIQKVGVNGIFLALLISPFLGFFLTLGDKIKRVDYLFLPLMIVISIALEIQLHIPSVFTVIFAAVWEQLLSRQNSAYRVVDVGGILYPFIYVYTGELIISFGFSVYLYGAGILLVKIFAEYLSVAFRKVKMPLKHIALRVPMAGLSLHHIILFKTSISGFLFSVITLALVLSEFFAPLLSLISRNMYKKV